jgi:hypothetical protein
MSAMLDRKAHFFQFKLYHPESQRRAVGEAGRSNLNLSKIAQPSPPPNRAS